MRAFVSLRRPAEFEGLRRRGRATRAYALTVYRSDRGAQGTSRVGITVGKAVGIAVVRNRVRRRLAAIAHEAVRGQDPMSVLIVASPQAAAASFAALREQVRRALS